MLISASLIGCTSNEEEETEDPTDISGDSDGDSTEMLNGALFVYIQSGSYAPEIIDENGPLYLHFSAPPMANESPYLLELICSVEEGHVSDVYQTWVNSSGGNAGDFNEITSWSVKNSASPNIQLEMFAYQTMSDINTFVHPMVVFEDNESLTGSGHLPADVFDQATFSCTDAVSDGTDDGDETGEGDGDGDGDGDGGEECPFPNEPGDTDSPCFAPECEDQESEACQEFVLEYCAANPDEGSCEMFEFVPIMDFFETLEMDVSGMCGTMSQMGTSMSVSGLMPTDDGTLVMVTFDRVVEYDGSDTRSMMMYHVTSEEAGLTVSMGIDTITFTPSEDGAHPWFDNMINLHLITAEEDDSGDVTSTEHKLILRDNYSEASDICDEFASDDDDSSSQTFSCSSTVGGTPDTVIDFALVNDGTEDCGDGSDEPQDFDGDGTVDNWFDCNDDESTTVSMNVVNDGSYDCPNAADEPGLDVEIEGDMPFPSLDGTACGESDEEDDGPMPTNASIEGLDMGGTVYVNMTFGDVTDPDYCSMEVTAFQFSPDGDWIMSSLTATNGSTTISMENWFDVELNTVEDADAEWSWGAADLNLMTTSSSLHMFDCGEEGVMGDDGEVEYGSQWILFNRVNDDIADCVDQSDESVDFDGDGISDVMFHCETPDDMSDDINMALVNDGNSGDCPNYSDEYMQTGSSYGTFDWDTTNDIADGFTSSVIIIGYSEHDINASELELRITITDSETDEITEEGHCGDMTNDDKGELSVLLTIPLDEMDSFATSFSDAHGKNWNAAWVDSDENGYVNNGDSITIYSPDTTDLYFTCVELHDTYVYMYTGDTPSMMTLPGFTAIFSLVAIIGAFVAITRRD